MVRGPVVASVLILLPGACASPAAASDDPAATVTALIAADNRGDLDGAIACYTADIVWLPPNADPVRGREAIAERYRGMFGHYAPRLSIEVEETRAGGELAFVRGVTSGELVPRSQDAPVPVHDAFLALLRREAAGWRITHLMWHPAPPAAQRAP